MVTTGPDRLRIRMYNVGFGDCLLVSFYYPSPVDGSVEGRGERHILVDFGSSSAPKSRLGSAAVAKMIEADCGGRLDAIVVTHRHKDHLSGFGTKSNAKMFTRLAPSLVVRSWTEDPRLSTDAGKPELLGAIDDGQAFAAAVVARAKRVGKGGQSEVAMAARNGVANAAAVDALETLSGGGRGEYLSAGQPTRLNELASGVRFRVLGPPLPKEWPDVERQAADSKEYWLGARRQVTRLFAPSGEHVAVPPGPTRWIIERLRDDEKRQIASLVQWLDDAMNNTSLILLITAGDHVLLFGGDAQIENWGWSLDQAKRTDPELLDLLSRVDLYKVGHHGSRNGTPRSLYGMWQNAAPRPFTALMSTKKGVHGAGERTVPRTNLVTKLRERGRLLSTEESGADWVEVACDLPDGAFVESFAPTAGPGAEIRPGRASAAAEEDPDEMGVEMWER
jgi:hypothetical protein